MNRGSGVGLTVFGVVLRLLPPKARMSRLKTTMPIPTKSRMMPAVWMLNPEACAETANLKTAPTVTSTMPNTVRPIPEPLFIFSSPLVRSTNGALQRWLPGHQAPQTLSLNGGHGLDGRRAGINRKGLCEAARPRSAL